MHVRESYVRRITKMVYLGGVPIGGGSPVVVESMTKTDTRDVKATIRQIKTLEEVGCEMVRVAVPDYRGRRGPGSDQAEDPRYRSSPTSTSTTSWR